MRMKKGQVWIETVIYILVGLSLISLILAFAIPKVNEKRDRAIIEQMINSLVVLDGKINEVIDAGEDNRRIVDFSMKTGSLYFDSSNERISFILDELNKPYSEPGVKIPLGRVIVETIKKQKTFNINLSLEYPGTDLTFQGRNDLKKFNPASIPYKFSIENKGIVDGKLNVDISL